MSTPQLENTQNIISDIKDARITDELSENAINMLCKYFGVTSLDSEEVKEMHETYRKYNKSPSAEEINTLDSKHSYHNLYRIYVENLRPKFRRYVITTIYAFACANLRSARDTLIITYDRAGARDAAKFVVSSDELCIVNHSLSFDMKVLFVDVAYMRKSCSQPDTVIMTLESMVEKEKKG